MNLKHIQTIAPLVEREILADRSHTISKRIIYRIYLSVPSYQPMLVVPHGEVVRVGWNSHNQIFIRFAWYYISGKPWTITNYVRTY